MKKRTAMREGSDLENMDNVLIDKFDDGVRDPQLKRELRKHAFEHSKMPYLEFRGHILRWIEDKQNQYVNCNESKKSITGMLFYILISLDPIHRRILHGKNNRFDLLMYTNKQYGSLFSNHTHMKLIKIQSKNMSTVNRGTE